MNQTQQFGIPVAMQTVNRLKPRRKGPTAIAKKSQDHVWQRALDVLGLETLNSKSSSIAMAADATTTMSSPAAASKPDSAISSISSISSIPDLPLEVQRNIIRHAASSDLIALSLVSKHFHSLAAEELYRTFHIVFPDEDDLSNDSPIDGLAGGLDTFVTSDYNYAKHLNEIILETLSGGDKGERTYKDYLYQISCGKFMNTLLLLTLRKAKSLETFRWDIRVELSRPVFKALHQIESLQNLHLRMQAGSSAYQIPPALGSAPPPTLQAGLPPTPPPPPPHAALPIVLPPIFSNAYGVGYKMGQKAHHKQLKSVLPTAQCAPPTLSGFKNLKTLTILDMDTYEYMEELKVCIRASSSTLNNLRLSFSDSFANKSRRPPPEIHSDDDSDQEDEFGQIPPPPGASDPNGPTHTLKAQEEKKKQDAVLGNILGWEPAVPKISKVTPTRLVVEKEKKPEEDSKRRFIRSLAPVAARLMSHVKPGSDQTAEGKELLDMIEKSCQAYLDSTDKNEKSSSPSASAGSSTAKGTPASSAASGDESTPNGSIVADGPGLFDEPKTKKKSPVGEPEVSNPDDIDMDEPEVDAEFETSAEPVAIEGLEKPDIEESLTDAPDGEVQDTITEESSAPLPETEQSTKAGELPIHKLANHYQMMQSRLALTATYNEIKRNGEHLRKEMDRLQAEQSPGPPNAKYIIALSEMDAEWNLIRERLTALSHDLDKLSGEVDSNRAESNISTPEMSDYVRTTRGLTLSNLEIYLIPVRANVLSQTIDLHVLQSITLLNVGPQQPFWNVMATMNNTTPLPLHKIYTDNVTLPFLVFVSQLDRLTELIMLERAPKPKVESTAAKTTVTIEQIRKLALKKHAATLKVLVLNNRSTMEWDVNIKSAMLLCQRGKNLEELACTYGTKTMHTMLQFMSGLESLRALHLYQFRDVDNCIWVTEGFRKFTVDVVCHNPQMKLEYIAFDSNIERLVRRKAAPSTKVSKGKGKAGQKANMLSELLMSANIGSSSGSGGAAIPSWEVAIASNAADWDSSEDEDNDVTLAKGLKIETVEGQRFCDITGVRIFAKDILNGSL